MKKKMMMRIMMMDSRRMKKMICRVVKVSGRSKARLEKHSLISADQPISDAGPVVVHHVHVPKGFMAVYVGPDHHRFVVPTKLLSVPGFRALMDMAAEEYGYEQQGGLTIPCDEDHFQKLLHYVSRQNHHIIKCNKSSLVHTH